MNWIAEELTIIPGSDIHCGDMPLGFVAGAFPFVPCHIPFFALVPSIVSGLDMPDRRSSYAEAEALLMACMRFTPLYVLHGEAPLFPWDRDSLSLLESLYMGGRTGVKLDTRGRSALDGHLFETEVLLAAPRRKGGSRAAPEPTRLCGAIFWKAHGGGELSLDESALFHWQGATLALDDALCAMCLGGDRTRSMGSVAGASRAPLPEGGIWGSYPVSLDGEWPVLHVPQEKRGPVPLLESGQADAIHGSWTVLTGRRFGASGKEGGPSGSGLAMDEGRIAWKAGWMKRNGSPGSVALAQPRGACLME